MKVAVAKKSWLLSMKYQNSREVKLSRAGPDYTREAPGTAYEGKSIKPILGISKLLQLVMCRTRLAVSAVLTTDHLFWLERLFSVRLLEPPHILPHIRNALCFR